MDIAARGLSTAWLWVAWGILGLVIFIAIRRAPWSKILESEASNVFFGAVVVVSLLWILRAGVAPGLGIHLLAVTSLCLMFDWQFAMIAASLVVLIVNWQQGGDWSTGGLNILVTGITPVLVTRGLLFVGQRFLPRNYFVYIFVNAFIAGALSMLAVLLLSAFLQHFTMPGTWTGSRRHMVNHRASKSGLYIEETAMTVLIRFICLTVFVALSVPGAYSGEIDNEDAEHPFAEHRVVLQVTSSDPKIQAMVLSNASNVSHYYGPDKVAIEIVAYGPGLSMLLKESANDKRVESLSVSGIEFSACGNTMKATHKTKDDLSPAAQVVPAGVVRIMELQEAGWTYVRP